MGRAVLMHNYFNTPWAVLFDIGRSLPVDHDLLTNFVHHEKLVLLPNKTSCVIVPYCPFLCQL